MISKKKRKVKVKDCKDNFFKFYQKDKKNNQDVLRKKIVKLKKYSPSFTPFNAKFKGEICNPRVPGPILSQVTLHADFFCRTCREFNCNDFNCCDGCPDEFCCFSKDCLGPWIKRSVPFPDEFTPRLLPQGLYTILENNEDFIENILCSLENPAIQGEDSSHKRNSSSEDSLLVDPMSSSSPCPSTSSDDYYRSDSLRTCHENLDSLNSTNARPKNKTNSHRPHDRTKIYKKRGVYLVPERVPRRGTRKRPYGKSVCPVHPHKYVDVTDSLKELEKIFGVKGPTVDPFANYKQKKLIHKTETFFDPAIEFPKDDSGPSHMFVMTGDMKTEGKDKSKVPSKQDWCIVEPYDKNYDFTLDRIRSERLGRTIARTKRRRQCYCILLCVFGLVLFVVVVVGVSLFLSNGRSVFGSML